MQILKRAAQGLGILARSDEAPAPAVSVRPPLRNSTGDVDNAMTLDSVYRAVQVLQTACGQLTLDAWRNSNPISVTPSILRKPNLDQSLSGFLTETVGSLAQRGNAYWHHDRGPGGEIINSTVLPPLEVMVTRKDARHPREYHWRGQHLRRDDISHLQLLRIPGKTLGLGPLQAWQTSAAGALRLRAYADTWLDTGGVPNGILSSDHTLTQDEASRYKAQWMESVSADEPAVLGKGLHYEPLLLKPSEVQWLESRATTPTEVARLFGIPSSLMLTAVKGASLTYQNLAQDTLQFVRWTLMAYLREIESAFSALLPRGQAARFNLDALLRADTKSRYDAHAVALTAGFLTIDEVRAIEGLRPLPTTQEAQEVPA